MNDKLIATSVLNGKTLDLNLFALDLETVLCIEVRNGLASNSTVQFSVCSGWHGEFDFECFKFVLEACAVSTFLCLHCIDFCFSSFEVSNCVIVVRNSIHVREKIVSRIAIGYVLHIAKFTKMFNI